MGVTEAAAKARQARAAVVDYIEVFYNTKRRHSSLSYVSAAEYERMEKA
jgi:transposase InsO family protein